MKKILLVSAVAIASAFQTEAVTAYQLANSCNGKAIEIVGGYKNLNSCALYSDSELKITATSSSTLRIDGLFGGKWTGNFKISGNYLYPADMDNYANAILTPTNGNYVTMTSAVYGSTINVYRISLLVCDVVKTNGYAYQYVTAFNYNQVYGTSIGTKWLGKITTDEYGNYVIAFGNDITGRTYQCLKLEYRNSQNKQISSNAYDIFDSYAITLPQYNGTGSFYDKDENFIEHDLQVIHNTSNNSFTIMNFANNGHMFINDARFEYEFDGARGVYNNDGTFTIPQMYFYDVTTGLRTQNKNTVKTTHYYTFGYDAETQLPKPDIHGTYKDVNLAHDFEGLNMWTEADGGTLKTLVDRKMTFEPFGATDNAGKYTAYPANHNYTIDFVEVDVTHGVEFDQNNYSFGCDAQNGLFLKLRPEPYRHHQYVVDYDFYIVPRIVDDIRYEASELCNENGLQGALKINVPEFDPSSAKPSNAPARANELSNKVVTALIPADKIKELGWDPNNKQYTAFIKTHYHNDTALEPTFHALMRFNDNNINTSVDTNWADEYNIDIYAAAGAIVVEGAEGAQVEVYTAAGIEVYAGTDSEIAVEAGLYIVKVGSKVQKVVVR